MKKHILLIIALLFITCLSYSQTNVTGLWEGKMNVGVELRLIFHFNQNENKSWMASIDCPEQGIKDLKASSVQITGDSVTIEVKQIGGAYNGKLLNDSTIDGKWTQGMSIPLTIKRINEITTIEKPQTPKPPFPYQSEDVLYFNKNKSIQYGATITIPQGKGPFPAVLLLTGSGQQNRDEEILGHKPFAVIADYLTRKGYVVLRVDDRGMGQTTGDVFTATTRDFANDAEVSLEYLKNRKEVDKNKIGLIGHSEGGMMAEIMAAERKDIDFIILLAAPGVKVTRLMAEQNEAILSGVGLPKSYIDEYLALYNSILDIATHTASKDEAKQKITDRVNEWVSKTPKAIVLATTGIKDETSKENLIDGYVKMTTTPWFTYFLNYDPDPYVRKIKAKVLALNGDKDVQVVSKSNLAGLDSSLKQGQSKVYDVKELKGLNHLFQHCIKCIPQEYGSLEETFAPEALDVMAEWMGRNVGSL